MGILKNRLSLEEQENKWSDNLNKIDEPKNDRFSFFEFLWDLIKTAIIVVVLAFVIKFFLIQPFIVDGSSMQPNFESNEYLLAEKVSYYLSSPKRGDVIIFHPPGQSNVNYIKRIIGMPGEKITIADNQIKIINAQYPNGFILAEPYIPHNFKTLTSENQNQYDVSSNEYFVLGDNREHSSDSREWGTLPKENIIGRAWIDIYPLSDFGIVERAKFSL